MTSRLRILLATAGLALTLGLPPTASAGGGAPDDVVRAEFLDGWVTRDGTRMAALRLTLAPGWKTYWRAPGDAGIPPSFDWSGSRNLGSVSYHWPSPEVFESYGLRTVGYKDELVLPIEFRPISGQEPMVIQGVMELGVCETICMPARLQFDARLQGRGESDPAIHAALANQPISRQRAGVGTVDCNADPISDGIRLTASIDMPRLPGTEIALVETGDPHVWVSEPDVERRGDRLQVTADLVPPDGRPMALDRSALRFTVIGASQAVDIPGCSSR